MGNIYKIIITDREREELIKAIEWYNVNRFDNENTLQMLKIHLKTIPKYEEMKKELCKQYGTLAQL